MIIERLSREHRNIEKLLAILERELEIFDRGDRPDYEVIHAIISYFKVYPQIYHHPLEDLVFAKLRIRDPAAAAKVGDLAREHQKGAERLYRVTQAVDSALTDHQILRQYVDTIVRDFIEHEGWRRFGSGRSGRERLRRDRDRASSWRACDRRRRGFCGRWRARRAGRRGGP